MTIRHLKTFCAVCRLGGITRAAEELCVAQPSVSQTVSELERYYGVKLFDRMGRKLLLTPEGERLRVKAEEAIAAFSEFEEAARDTMERRSVRIGTSVTVGQMLLPRLVRALKEEMGNVECRAVVRRARSILPPSRGASRAGSSRRSLPPIALLPSALRRWTSEGRSCLRGLWSIRCCFAARGVPRAIFWRSGSPRSGSDRNRGWNLRATRRSLPRRAKDWASPSFRRRSWGATLRRGGLGK